MTLQEIEQMKSDREIGTPPDGWSIDVGGEVHRYGSTIFAWPEHSDQSNPDKIYADMRRGSRIPNMEAEILQLREALTHIDALDPENQIDGVSYQALRGIVLRMGEIARDALNNTEM